MPKAPKPTTKPKPKSTAANGLRKPPAEFYWDVAPLPRSPLAWNYCARISRLAYQIESKTDADLVSIHGEIDHATLDRIMTSFLDVADAMQAMRLMCLKSHARVTASAIKASKAGVRFAPAKPHKAA